MGQGGSRQRGAEEPRGEGLAGVGRRGWDSEQESSRVEGGKREDTSLLEGLGVWAGLGLHLQPDTPDTPALRVIGMQWSDMSHHERERDCNRGEGTAEPVPQLPRGHASACGQAHFACVCVLKSHSAGSPEAGDGCSARRGREASALLPGTAAVSYWDTSALFVCTRAI